MMRRYFSTRLICLIAGLALTAGALSACGNSGTSGDTSTLRVGLSDQVVNLSPPTAPTAANTITTLIHRGLTTFDAEGKVIPALAQSFSMVNDLTYEFQLHEGLTFQDGTPINSSVVKATLDYVISPESGSRAASVLGRIVASIEASSDSVIRINLNHPFSALPEYLATPGMVIVPKNALSPGSSAWVGAGPFKIEKRDDTGITMVKSESYYDADKVSLQGIDVKFYKDPTARTNALRDGSVDFIDYVASQDIDRLSTTGGIKVVTGGGAGLYLTYNVTDTPLSEPLVRQAISLAINRENIVSVALDGQGAPLTSVLKPSQEFADPALADAWTYNPERAKALLAEAGYPNGFKATFLTTAQYPYHQDAAVSIQSDLAKIGIDVTLDNPDFAARMDKGAKGDYEIAINGNFGLTNDPSYLLDWVTGAPYGNRSFGFNDPALNETLQSAMSSTGDEQRDLYYRAQQMIVDQVPFTALVDRIPAYGLSDRVNGFVVLPNFLGSYSGYTLADVRMD